jgi:hypothetical protein
MGVLSLYYKIYDKIVNNVDKNEELRKFLNLTHPTAKIEFVYKYIRYISGNRD